MFVPVDSPIVLSIHISARLPLSSLNPFKCASSVDIGTSQALAERERRAGALAKKEEIEKRGMLRFRIDKKKSRAGKRNK